MSELMAWFLVVVFALFGLVSYSRWQYWSEEWLKEYTSHRRPGGTEKEES